MNNKTVMTDSQKKDVREVFDCVARISGMPLEWMVSQRRSRSLNLWRSIACRILVEEYKLTPHQIAMSVNGLVNSGFIRDQQLNHWDRWTAKTYDDLRYQVRQMMLYPSLSR